MPCRLALSLLFVSFCVSACGSAGDETPTAPEPAARPTEQGAGSAGEAPRDRSSEPATPPASGPSDPDARQDGSEPIASDAPSASQLVVRQASDEPGAPFYKPEVEVMESMPVQFALRLTRDLPVAGGRLVADDVRVDRGAARIVAKITEHGPDGPSATVITPTELRLAFGSLQVGRYRLDLLLRQGEEDKYELLQSLTLIAK